MSNSNTKTVHRPCPICASTSAHRLHHQRFALSPDHPLPAAFDIVECVTCGFVYSDTTANAAAYDRYYADFSKYADQGTSTGGGGDTLDHVRIEATAAEIARHIPDLSARIVDIGCANGGVLGALHARGYSRLLGVDPSPECVANAARLFGIPAQQGWLGAMPSLDGPADFVILSHVLEHVLDLADSIRRTRALLAPDGLVYVEVPDATRYDDCLVAPFQDFNTEHINHFNSASLANLMAAQGFEMVAEGTKTLEAAGGAPYPACFGFFRRRSAARPLDTWRRALEFLPAINRYIKRSNAMLANIDAKLASVCDGPVIVWGAGQLTLKLLIETRLGQIDIAAFTDGNPIHHGKMLGGRSIITPENLRHLPPYPIIVGSLLHHAAIAGRIRRDLALPNPIVVLSDL
jgi:2-polyprenyl-3-methyl-5-hydroxy-6-metoxy-1,4-benzoquinol methylase